MLQIAMWGLDANSPGALVGEWFPPQVPKGTLSSRSHWEVKQEEAQKGLLVKGLDAKHQAQQQREAGTSLCSSLTLHTSALARDWPWARCSLHAFRFSCVSQTDPMQNEHCSADSFRVFKAYFFSLWLLGETAKIIIVLIPNNDKCWRHEVNMS